MLVCAPWLAAQTPKLQPGARVRVIDLDRGNAVAYEGALSALRGDTVLLSAGSGAGGISAVALGGSRSLEVAGPSHHHVGRRVLLGAGIGAAAGAVIGLATYRPCNSSEFMGCMLDFGPGGNAAGGAIIGVVSGTLVGLVVGLVATDRDWYPASTQGVRVGMVPLPSGRIGVGAALSF